jgi:hypothetical protein
VILHNFANRTFLHVDDAGYRTWAFLDGARTVSEVTERVGGDPRRTRELVDAFAAHGFVELKP